MGGGVTKPVAHAQQPASEVAGARVSPPDVKPSMSGGGNEMAAELFRLENAVNENGINALQARMVVQENNALLSRNRGAAMGNRALCTENTDALFRDRLTILRTWGWTSDELRRAYCDAMVHREKIAYLKHLAGLNTRTLEITLAMAGVNASAIEVNKRVMDTNEEIVSFNQAYIEENAKWLDEGPVQETPTAAGMEEIVQQNRAELAELTSLAVADKERVHACLDAAKINCRQQAKNAKMIQERAKKIEANRSMIQANQQAVASKLATSY